MRDKKLIIFVIIVGFIGVLFLAIFLGFWEYNSGKKKDVIGVYDEEIVIGSSAAIGGHASFLGTQTIRGSLAYINEINEKGGVHGRKIKLISYDDKYNPSLTVKNTKRLIGRDHVFALFDYVGTPTSVKIINITTRAKVPLIGLFTGAETLRVPFRPYIFNIRDSYYSETEGAISYFVDNLGFKKIAVFYQDDAFGLTVLKGTRLALEKRGINPVAVATYTRGTMDVEDAIDIIKYSEAEAVIMVGTYAPLAKFVKYSNDEGFRPYFHTVSFVGSEAFAEQLIEVQRVDKSEYKKIIVTQVVPSPFSEEFETVREYKKMMKKYFPWDDVNYVGLEGFVNAKVLVEGLERAGRDLTRKKFIEALENMKNFDIGIGENINYNITNHQGLNGVYYSCLCKGERFEIFNFSEVENGK